jgi:hypothetical protein
MNRRTHLISLVALGICVSGWTARPIYARIAQDKKADTKALERVLAMLFAECDGARAVGYLYLAEFPESAHGVLERARALLGPLNHGATALAETLTRQRQEEFARSETVILGGWVLARCEADMCAALALLSSE